MSVKAIHLPPIKWNHNWRNHIYRDGVAYPDQITTNIYQITTNFDLAEEWLTAEEKQVRFHWNVSGKIPCEIKNFNTICLSFNYDEITCKKCCKLLNVYKIFPTFEGEAIEVCRDSVIEKDYKKGLIVLEQNCVEGAKYIPFLFELILIMSRWLTKDDTSFKDIIKDDRSAFLSVLKARTEQRVSSLETLVTVPHYEDTDTVKNVSYWDKLLGRRSV